MLGSRPGLCGGCCSDGRGLFCHLEGRKRVNEAKVNRIKVASMGRVSTRAVKEML